MLELLTFDNFALGAILAIGMFAEGKASKIKTLPLTLSLLNLVHAYFTRRRTSFLWKLSPFLLVWGLSQKNLKGVDAMLEDRLEYASAWLDKFDANYETGFGGTSLLQVLASQSAEAANQPYTRSVKLLLKRGAKIDFQRESDKATALMLAANEGNVAMVKLCKPVSAHTERQSHSHRWAAAGGGARLARASTTSTTLPFPAISPQSWPTSTAASPPTCSTPMAGPP